MYCNFQTFFSSVQEAPWYHEFLNPVVQLIPSNTNLLDIGTGSGKLPQLLAKEKNVDCIGIDTNQAMLSAASEKLSGLKVKLIKVKNDNVLPFVAGSFDNITICNVLFLLNEKSINQILNESIRLLRHGGKIIILTPTGNYNVVKLCKEFHSLSNLSIYLWYYATRKKASIWRKNQKLLKYSRQNHLKYKKITILNGFAEVEILDS